MKIAIIGCSKSKQNYACRADEMYTGTIFQKSYEVAKQITDNIYILSAKYGLLKPDTDATLVKVYKTDAAAAMMEVNRKQKLLLRSWR